MQQRRQPPVMQQLLQFSTKLFNHRKPLTHHRCVFLSAHCRGLQGGARCCRPREAVLNSSDAAPHPTARRALQSSKVIHMPPCRRKQRARRPTAEADDFCASTGEMLPLSAPTAGITKSERSAKRPVVRGDSSLVQAVAPCWHDRANLRQLPSWHPLLPCSQQQGLSLRHLVSHVSALLACLWVPHTRPHVAT